MIWKKQRDSCVTFYRAVIRFAFQLANMPVKFDKENEVRERIPHTCPSSYENFFQSILGSLSILRMAPHWSVKRLTSCSHGNNKTKIIFAVRARTNNRFQIIIMGHRDSLSYLILS